MLFLSKPSTVASCVNHRWSTAVWVSTVFAVDGDWFASDCTIRHRVPSVAILQRNRSNWRVYGRFALAERTGEEPSDS